MLGSRSLGAERPLTCPKRNTQPPLPPPPKSNASLRAESSRSGAEVQREERWGTGRSSDGAEPAALIVCGRRFQALLRRPRSAPSPAAPKVNRASGATSQLGLAQLGRGGARRAAVALVEPPVSSSARRSDRFFEEARALPFRVG